MTRLSNVILLSCVVYLATVGQPARAFAATPSPKSTSARPNILLILADDLGYGDISSFRGDAIWKTVVPAPSGVKPTQTPHIDRLAAGGLMLTSFYANDSVCSPTRAAIMTGRYQHRSGMINVLGQLTQATRKFTPPGQESFVGLRLSETTMAEVMRDGGYRTACFGKWHLGPLESHQPLDQGFEHFVGTSGGAEDNFQMRNAHGKSIFWRDRKPVDAPGKYFADVLADEAIAYMTKNDDRPFFVYLPFTSPHVPYFGPGDRGLAEKWDHEGNDGPREDLHQAYKEVVEAMDAAVGRIHKALHDANLEDNTLIVFTSDNGPVDFGSCVPFRGRKTNSYEGGIREPTIAHWPGHIKAGTRTTETAISMDLLPTFAAIGDCPLPSGLKLDGTDLTELLTNGEPLPHRMLFWERGTGVEMRNFNRRLMAVRDGTWKLVREKAEKPLELYDLQSDPGERHDIAHEHPEVIDRLQKAFEEWKADVYSDCPYKIDELINQLKTSGVIKK